MLTQAEKTGMKNLAKQMSLSDLKWQIENASKCGLSAEATKIFKDELATRK